MDVGYGASRSPEQSLRKAFELTQKSLTLNSTCALPYYTLSLCHLFARHHQEAIDASEKAVNFDPNDSMAHSMFAIVLAYSGKSEEAKGEIEKAFRLNPKPQAVFFSCQGIVYLQAGMYEEAISANQNGLSIEPNHIKIHYRLAACYSLIGRDDEARAEITALLKLSPKLSAGYLSKVLPYKNKADLDRIISALRKAGLPE